MPCLFAWAAVAKPLPDQAVIFSKWPDRRASMHERGAESTRLLG